MSKRNAAKFWNAKFTNKLKWRRKLLLQESFMVMVSFYFSCFLCDRSSRWDSELCAQLPWKPSPRGDWAPVGGRSRRTTRRGSCQGRPDSSRYIGLQRPDVHFGHNTGRDWGKFLPAVNAELARNEIYITAGIFLDADGFVQVHFFF